MAANAGLIRAGGSFIEMVLDKTAAIQGMREFEQQFRASQMALSRMGSTMSFGRDMSNNVSRSLAAGIRSVMSGDLFTSAFFRAGQALGAAVNDVFSGAFFARLGREFQKAGMQLTIGGAISTTIFATISSMFVKPLRDFAQAEQLMGRFQSVFGDLADEAQVFADTLARDVNQSVYATRDQITSFQSVLRGMDFEPGEALYFAKVMTTLTNDLQAFDDSIRTPEEAMDRLLSGLNGMVMPVQRFGANVRVSNMELEMMRLGINETSLTATQKQRALTRINIIMEAMQRSGIIGQAAREYSTLAARMRGAEAATGDLSKAIGGALSPVANNLLVAIKQIAVDMKDWVDANQNFVVTIAATSVGLTALSAAATASGVALLVLGVHIRALGAIMGVLVSPLRVVTVALGGFMAMIGAVVAGGQATVAMMGGITRWFIALSGTARGILQLGAAWGQMAIAMAKVVGGTVLTGLGRLLAYLGTLGRTGVVTLGVLSRGVWSTAAAFTGLTIAAIRLTGAFAMGVIAPMVIVRSAALARLSSILVMRFRQLTVAATITFFRTLAVAVGAASSALLALGTTLATGVVGVVTSAGTALAGLAGVAVSSAGFIASSFVAVIVPIAAATAVIVTLGVAIYRLAPAIRDAFGRGLDRAVEGLRFLRDIGKSAFGVLLQGFDKLKVDAAAAMQGVAAAILNGDIWGAVEILWAMIQVEFYRGWSTVAPIWVQFGSWLVTTLNGAWTAVVQVFNAGYIEVASVAGQLVAVYNRIVGTIAGVVKSTLGFITDLVGGTTGDMSQLWNSSEGFLLQMVDIIKDSMMVAVNALLATWDQIVGAIERAWILMKSLVDSSIDLDKEFKKISERNVINQEGRNQWMTDEINKRDAARKTASEQLKAAKAAARALVEEEARAREAKGQALFKGIEENANKGLQDAIAEFNGLLAKQHEIRANAPEAVPGEDVLGVLGDRIKELLGVGGNNKPKLVGRQSEAAFADVAKFSLGTTDISRQQLRELKQINENGRKQLAKEPAGPPRAAP